MSSQPVIPPGFRPCRYWQCQAVLPEDHEDPHCCLSCLAAYEANIAIRDDGHYISHTDRCDGAWPRVRLNPDDGKTYIRWPGSDWAVT